ncbi:MAG: alpha/beta hydrolase [Chloroflexi bacterium]|nr:alpha/beta hydrolase [Chloroflexota bacterium]
MPKAPINGIQLYYEDAGRGLPVVFCHGAGGNHESWFQQAPAFSKQYRCIAIDHRGFGQSLDVPNGPGGDAFVQDMEGLVAHLGLGEIVLVAQSMGGRTALGYTLAHPGRVRALVLADTTGGATDDEMEKVRESLVPPVQGQGDLLSRALGLPFQQQYPEKAQLYHSISAKNPPRDEASFGRMRANPIDARSLKTLKVPTLLIVGEVDVLAPPPVIELLHQRIPGSRLAKVPGAGHSVYFEQPEEFNRIVLGFLADVLKE